MFQDFSKFFKIFQDFLPCWRKFVVATSEQVQILVYFPGRSGPSTRAVGGWWVVVGVWWWWWATKL